MQKFVCSLTILSIILLCHFLKAQKLANIHPQRGSIEDQVKKKLCFAGQVKITNIHKQRNIQICTAKFLSQIASSNNHPNARKLGKVRIVPGKVSIKRGQIYCMIIASGGSKLGFSIVAYGNDTPENIFALTKIMKSSDSFRNSDIWKKRRKLWRHFYQDVQPKNISVYCENDNLDTLVYVQTEKNLFLLFVYKLTTRKSSSIEYGHLRGINRITYANGEFLLWYCGNIETCFDAK